MTGILPVRTLAALWAGKLTGVASRRLGAGGGTTFPGDVARWLDPAILTHLARGLERGTVLVTGTNGKTTTAHLLRAILSAEGHAPVSNPSGANLVFGLTAAMIRNSDLAGRSRAGWGLFEIDEASFPRAVAETDPRVVVVTNLFRDQLDRFGELDTTAGLINSALAQVVISAVRCLNADDPLVAFMGGNQGRVLHFGMELESGEGRVLGHGADARACPRCGVELQFRIVTVGHLGDYSCPGCGLERPRPALVLDQLELDGMRGLSCRLRYQGKESLVTLGLAGRYNAYNLLAAAAAALACGVPLERLAGALAGIIPAFGRAEAFDLQGVTVHMLLAKNPTGFNEALRTAVETGGAEDFLIAINDGIADGRDVSWLWDVDFEILAGARTLTLSGLRARDMAVRLKYGGIDPGRLQVAEELETGLDQAVAQAAAHSRPQLFVLCTYTAMLGLRAVLERRGQVRRYWDEG